MFRYSSDTMRSPIDGNKRKEKPIKIKTYSCDLCYHGKWQNETEVEIHRKNVHKAALLRSVNDKNNHFCRICVRQFKDEAAVLRHIKSVHLLSSPTAPGVEREIFICDYCNNVFFNKRLLTAHMSYTHLPKHRKFKERIECPLCLKTLKLQTVWSHFLYHKIHNISTCQICLKTCENKSELQEHLKSHPYYYHCDVCGFHSKYSSTYYQHTITHKTNVKQNICLVNVDINMYFASRYNVTWKYDLDPTGLKGLRIPKNIKICVLCREICTNEELVDHILKDHSIEEESKKKHKCVCGEEFFNNVLLKHHIFKLKGNHAVDKMDQENQNNECENNEGVIDKYHDEELELQDVGVNKARVTESNIVSVVMIQSEDQNDIVTNEVIVDNDIIMTDNDEADNDNDVVDNDNDVVDNDNDVVDNDNVVDSENMEIVVQNVGNSQNLDLSDEHVEVFIHWN